MIINCRTWSELPDHGESQRRRVFVDGVEIKQVWYVDTDAGFVRTYDLGYGKPPRTSWGFARENFPADWEIDAPPDDIVSRTIRGNVELKPI